MVPDGSEHNRLSVLKKSLPLKKGGNWEDRKCLGKMRRSFVGPLINAISFSRIPEEKVFNSHAFPQLSISTDRTGNE
jgi:hypothetical protein